MTPATERVLAWIAALFGEDVTARVFHPLVADWQHEMRHAHCGVPRLRSAIAGTLALGSAALMTAVSMATPWRAAPAMRWSTRRTLAGVGTVGTLILLAPFLKYQDGSLRLALWLVALMPSSLPVALSFALLPAAMACAAVAPASARVRSRFFVVGVTAITIVYVTLSVAWLGPLANQIWREAIAGASLDRHSRARSFGAVDRRHTQIRPARARGRVADEAEPGDRLAGRAGALRVAGGSPPRAGHGLRDGRMVDRCRVARRGHGSASSLGQRRAVAVAAVRVAADRDVCAAATRLRSSR